MTKTHLSIVLPCEFSSLSNLMDRIKVWFHYSGLHVPGDEGKMRFELKHLWHTVLDLKRASPCCFQCNAKGPFNFLKPSLVHAKTMI